MVTTFFGDTGPIRTPARKHPPGSTAPMAHIVVQPLSASEWRVCDRELPEHDARSLLGYIQQKNDRFEVMDLGSGFDCLSCASLEEATEHFAAAGPGGAADCRRPELSWSRG